MYHFIFDALPTSENPKFGTYGGATVGCWVQRETQREAESVARAWIGDQHWTITSLEEASIITRDTQLPAGLQYFEQAETDGEVFIFYTSPIGAHDDTNVA
jgi:hypothetical protein